MKYSKKQIDSFMAIGKAEKFHLRWHELGDSFFDEEVQKVLLRFHPNRYEYRSTLDKGFPVAAWRIADQVCLCVSNESWNDLFSIWRQVPLWTAELLAAIMKHRKEKVYDSKSATATIDQIKNWINTRSFRERNIFLFEDETGAVKDYSLSHEQIVERNTLAKRTAEELERLSKTASGRKELKKRRERHDIEVICAPPLPICEPLPPAKKWMDGKRKLSAEAYRQARLTEDRRRDEIMLLWAESWLAYLCVTPSKKG